MTVNRLHLGLLVLALACAGCKPFASSLPKELAKLECKPATNYPYRTEAGTLRLAGTTIVVPCMAEQNPDVMAAKIELAKRPDGGLEKSELMNVTQPTPAQVRFYAYGYPDVPRPQYDMGGYLTAQWEKSGRTRLVVKTPPAFAVIGPETIFWCNLNEERPQHPRNCAAYTRSRSLNWTVTVRFPRPYPENFDMDADVAEGYRLIAAHIVRQDEPGK